MDIKRIISSSPEEVMDWALKEYFTPMYNTFETPEALCKISEDMVMLVNQYSYLASVLSVLKVECRNKKNCGDKKKYEELIDKRDIIQRALDSVKLKQSVLSRMVTIKQEIDKEINMSKAS